MRAMLKISTLGQLRLASFLSPESMANTRIIAIAYSILPESLHNKLNVTLLNTSSMARHIT
jgi:hypothetical protein